MAAFKELFGDKLQSKDGTVDTESALGGKTAIFVYFSAHWCPPCRGFTPKLVEFHNKHFGGKGFETVFVSSDKSSEQFDEYYGEMPWLALPFAKSDVKAALSKKYKVQGIPSLVILSPDGKVITKDGRSKIMENFDDCKGFPWVPKSLQELLGDAFVKQDGSTVGKEAIVGKTLGLYFSAHWCPPCRGFTPKLKEFYAAYKAKEPNFEIIFVSSDKSESEAMDYFKNDHGDYLCLPYSKRDEKAEISSMFGVEGIPSFVVLGPDGKTLNASGRGKVMAGADAVVSQGWEAPAVGDMAEGPEAGGTDINECPTIVVMCEGVDTAVQQAIFDAMAPLAKKYIEEGKKSDEDPKYIFLIAKGGGPMDQLKGLTTKAAGDDIKKMEGKPVMLLFDIPDQGGFYLAPEQELTTANIEAFIKSKEEGKETRRQLG
eukprot:CAMPEP_0171270312 /NCGR_PEP_ID=MMETSP0790-20130122/60643_1 /TAXON_ID=2925 /ORGANISM="Alexandrium catenella, Strain OF101" /LENGTH=428 /DNA_ID=CAMNT_0011739143 /DNA_START=78 /DNA_END=1364 /DNA_ORIENTATION=-